MVDRMCVAGAVALAGLLALAPPIEAFGRGMGGGFHAGVHRAAAPAFHNPVVPAVHSPAVPASPRAVVQVPVRRMAAFRLRRFAARHRRNFGFGFPSAAVGDSTPYYGDYGAYPPVDPAVAGDVALDGPPDLQGGPALLSAVPACRTQDYVVPDQRGERRTVRVLRC